MTSSPGFKVTVLCKGECLKTVQLIKVHVADMTLWNSFTWLAVQVRASEARVKDQFSPSQRLRTVHLLCWKPPRTSMHQLLSADSNRLVYLYIAQYTVQPSQRQFRRLRVHSAIVSSHTITCSWCRNGDSIWRRRRSTMHPLAAFANLFFIPQFHKRFCYPVRVWSRLLSRFENEWWNTNRGLKSAGK